MTEREILKQIIEVCERETRTPEEMMLWLKDLRMAIREAQTVLASTTEPEHPAVEAYRNSTAFDGGSHPAVIFLAGWKQALAHIADNFDELEYMQARKHLIAASNATPTQLP